MAPGPSGRRRDDATSNAPSSSRHSNGQAGTSSSSSSSSARFVPRSLGSKGRSSLNGGPGRSASLSHRHAGSLDSLKAATSLPTVNGSGAEHSTSQQSPMHSNGKNRSIEPTEKAEPNDEDEEGAIADSEDEEGALPEPTESDQRTTSSSWQIGHDGRRNDLLRRPPSPDRLDPVRRGSRPGSIRGDERAADPSRTVSSRPRSRWDSDGVSDRPRYSEPGRREDTRRPRSRSPPSPPRRQSTRAPRNWRRTPTPPSPPPSSTAADPLRSRRRPRSPSPHHSAARDFRSSHRRDDYEDADLIRRQQERRRDHSREREQERERDFGRSREADYRSRREAEERDREIERRRRRDSDSRVREIFSAREDERRDRRGSDYRGRDGDRDRYERRRRRSPSSSASSDYSRSRQQERDWARGSDRRRPVDMSRDPSTEESVSWRGAKSGGTDADRERRTSYAADRRDSYAREGARGFYDDGRPTATLRRSSMLNAEHQEALKDSGSRERRRPLSPPSGSRRHDENVPSTRREEYSALNGAATERGRPITEREGRDAHGKLRADHRSTGLDETAAAETSALPVAVPKGPAAYEAIPKGPRTHSHINGHSSSSGSETAHSTTSRTLSAKSAWKVVGGEMAPPSTSQTPVNAPTGPRASRPSAAGNGGVPLGPRALHAAQPTRSVTADSRSPAPAAKPLSPTIASKHRDQGRAPSPATGSPPPPPPASAPPKEVDDAPPPPPSLTFEPVPLPFELSNERRREGWSVKAEPGPQGKGATKGKPQKISVDPERVDTVVTDPRRNKEHTLRRVSKSNRHFHSKLLPVSWAWDSNSTGPKPPPPPRAVVVTGLSPLVTQMQLRSHFRGYGRIAQEEMKTDPQSGESLGVFWLQFVHDYDDDDPSQVVEGASSVPQRGDLCAQKAVAELDGQRFGIGGDVMHVELDAGKGKYTKTYREILGQRYAKQSSARAATTTSAQAQASAASDSKSPAAMRRTEGSRTDRLPSRAMPDPGEDRYQQRQRLSAALRPERGDQQSRSPAHLQAAKGPSDTVEPASRIHSRLAQLGTSYVYIPRSSIASNLNAFAISRHFQMFLPHSVSTSDDAWYVAFNSQDAASRSHMVLGGKPIGGCKVEFEVRPPPSEGQIEARKLDEANQVRREMRAGVVTSSAAFDRLSHAEQIEWHKRHTEAEKKAEQGWTERAILDEARSTIVRELLDVFARDLKNRVIGPHLSSFLQADAAGGQALKRAAEKKLDEPSTAATTPAHDPTETDESVKPESKKAAVEALPSFRRIRKTALSPPPERRRWLSAADHAKTSPSTATASTSPTPSSGAGDAVDAAYIGRKAAEARARAAGAGVSSHDGKGSRYLEAKSKVADDDLSADDLQEGDSLKGSHGTPRKTSKRHDAIVYSSDSDGAEPDQETGTARGQGLVVKDDLSRAEGTESPFEEGVEAKSTTGKAVKSRKAPATTKKAAKKKGVTFVGGQDAVAVPLKTERQLLREQEMLKLSTDVSPVPEVKSLAPPAPKKKQSAPRPRSPTPDPFALGIAEDSEDLYYLKVAIERLKAGDVLTPAAVPENEAEEIYGDSDMHEVMEAVSQAPVTAPPLQSGSARTEGFYKIPAAQKAAHLPDRNKAIVDTTTNVTLASARDNRADSRRLVLGIEQHKKDSASDTDILKFNQLRSRKKQLKFAKSPIHDWGLYAMEIIPPGDMVIEYVGEVIRQQVADHRERQYEKQGNFSTYLFRVDDDLVVDATHKGNIARLMNHCCVPNCNARILTLNGQKRIVLYAKTTILPGQELTYDYKFQATADDEDAIACLCGAEGCRRFL